MTTTPLIYLSALVRKRFNDDSFSAFIYEIEELLLFEVIQDRRNLSHCNMKHIYLDYFVQWTSFYDLCNDIYIKRGIPLERNRQKINAIEPIFQEVFPLDKNKLLKIWNLMPRSEIFDRERLNSLTETSSPNRGMLFFAKTWEGI